MQVKRLHTFNIKLRLNVAGDPIQCSSRGHLTGKYFFVC